MAAPPSNLFENMKSFSTKKYTESWAARNWWYSRGAKDPTGKASMSIPLEFNMGQGSNKSAANKSGIVHSAHYEKPQDLWAPPRPTTFGPGGTLSGGNMSDPRLQVGSAIYTQFGKPAPQRGSQTLGWAMLDPGYISGALKQPVRGSNGSYNLSSNPLNKFFNEVGLGRPLTGGAAQDFSSPITNRPRNFNNSSGWQRILTSAPASGGRGPSRSSRDRSGESYSTIETRMGKSMYTAPGEKSNKVAGLNPDLFKDFTLPTVKLDRMTQLSNLYNPGGFQRGTVRKDFGVNVWGMHDSVFGQRSS